MNIIFQIWSKLIYRKCYFQKLNSFKMEPKTMFASFAAMSHALLPRLFLVWFYLFSHAQLSNPFKRTLNQDAYCLESWTDS